MRGDERGDSPASHHSVSFPLNISGFSRKIKTYYIRKKISST
jgi:hypothetical protein